MDSLYFTMLDHNKRSITLNTKTARGRAIFTRLVEECDVLVENFAPGALDRMGFTWQRIQEINPRIVYASVKGFGPGPYQECKVYEPAALYEVFAPELARNMLRRLEFHFVPKHASWLNMVESEIGVLSQQCLDRRIPDRETLQREVAHWQRRRNAEGARVEWMFDVQRAREKLGRVYPSPLLSDLAQAA